MDKSKHEAEEQAKRRAVGQIVKRWIVGQAVREVLRYVWEYLIQQ
ncbi:hypothetical protein [Streptomyces sp. NPDC055134]